MYIGMLDLFWLQLLKPLSPVQMDRLVWHLNLYKFFWTSEKDFKQVCFLCKYNTMIHYTSKDKCLHDIDLAANKQNRLRFV